MSTNKIIITTDLSPESFSAFIIGKEYSKALNCEIELLTVLEDPVQAAMIYAMEYPVFPGVEIQKQLFERVQKELDGLAKEHFGGFKVTTTVREAHGPVHSEITSYAQAEKAKLLIISSHGRSGFKGLLIGSVAERVARHAQCPVLIVPCKK